MNISASELIKQSAAQMLYYYMKRQKRVFTPGMEKGEEYAQEIVKKEEASAEKRGIVPLDGGVLFFCIDMVKDNLFVELKMVDDRPVENWYRESSIMQATFYASLLTKVKSLDTPTFRKKEGFKQEILKMPSSFEFQLWFGSEKYLIYPNNAVLNHYLTKADLIINSLPLLDFDACRDFDADYKFKEFSIYKPNYKKL